MSHEEKPRLHPDDAEQLAKGVARQQVMQSGPAFTGRNGTIVYRVVAGWECEQLKLDDKITSAKSSTELDSAMQDPDGATIFIPKNAALNEETIGRVVNSNTLSKTIFWEA